MKSWKEIYKESEDFISEQDKRADETCDDENYKSAYLHGWFRGQAKMLYVELLRAKDEIEVLRESIKR